MDLDALLGLLFFVVFIVVPLITGARKRGQNAKRQQQGQQQGQLGQQGRDPGQLFGGPSTQGPGGGLSGPPASSGTQQAGPNRPGDHPASTALEEIRRRVQEAQERERQRDAERKQGRGDRGRTAGPEPRPSGGLVSSDPFERGLVSGTSKSIAGGQLGREGTSSGWPPPAGDLMAGRPNTSILGRQGAQTSSQTQSSGRPSLLGREGMSRGSSAGGLGREGSTGLGAMPTSTRSLLGREGRSLRKKSLEAGEIGAGDAQPGLSPYGARLGGGSLVNVDREGIVKGLIWHEILKEAPGKRRLRRTRSRPR